MTNTVSEKIKTIVINHIMERYGIDMPYARDIFSSIKSLLQDTYQEYEFPSSLDSFKETPINIDDFQISLSKINEKETRRKSSGVYYTDGDVTDFMVLNSYCIYIYPGECSVFDVKTIKERLKTAGENHISKILLSTVFDPTCGAGAFLVSALSQKIELLKSMGKDAPLITDIIGTIKGNDIESKSTDISKLRLFFLAVDSFKDKLDVRFIAKEIYKSFKNVDIIDYKKPVFGSYDIIVGNPPYIEYGKYEGNVNNDYGNVYADVMKNVSTMLNPNGVLAFVVPLSYISTARMSSIREYVQSNTGKQLLLNFADRPDCLFTGVHQKLTIVLAQKTKEISGIFTSKYNHWYKTEREALFNSLSLERIQENDNRYWPKIGDSIAASIYDKILSFKGRDILSLNMCDNRGSIWMNLRACFWMKVFSRDMKSNSYKEFRIDNSRIPFILCLLNSSLFFLIWTIISDGWHITNKELSIIKIPDRIPKADKWQILYSRLEKKLETTKEYVGTKQVDYEYKHKLCKDIIDEIDDELKTVYKLSKSELNYIKRFNEKYRISDGA